MSEIPFDDGTAIISISDVGDEGVDLKFAPEYLLRLEFDDVDNDVILDSLGRRANETERESLERKYKMLSDAQADQIASFYYDICDSIKTIVCQCEHGQSRSAAVAAAIMEYRTRRGIRVFSDDKYYPNKVVFRKVLAALQNTEGKERRTPNGQ